MFSQTNILYKLRRFGHWTDAIAIQFCKGEELANRFKIVVGDSGRSQHDEHKWLKLRV